LTYGETWNKIKIKKHLFCIIVLIFTTFLQIV
jgi:hypothetical protein